MIYENMEFIFGMKQLSFIRMSQTEKQHDADVF